jgi:oligopeptide/dipeptide ABC transporter ATP-binding protein
MRQRLMIAIALSCNPSLILADEPTTALDVTIQAQILDLLKEISRTTGAATLIITHNLGVVARYADRVNVMYAGRIIERGTAREIYGNPRHPYTLGLLRSVPRLDEPRRERLDPIQGQPPDLTRLPRGCAFAPRCTFAIDRCREEAPPLKSVGGTHLSACWVSESLPARTSSPREGGEKVDAAQRRPDEGLRGRATYLLEVSPASAPASPSSAPSGHFLPAFAGRRIRYIDTRTPAKALRLGVRKPSGSS